MTDKMEGAAPAKHAALATGGEELAAEVHVRSTPLPISSRRCWKIPVRCARMPHRWCGRCASRCAQAGSAHSAAAVLTLARLSQLCGADSCLATAALAHERREHRRAHIEETPTEVPDSVLLPRPQPGSSTGPGPAWIARSQAGPGGLRSGCGGRGGRLRGRVGRRRLRGGAVARSGRQVGRTGRLPRVSRARSPPC